VTMSLETATPIHHARIRPLAVKLALARLLARINAGVERAEPDDPRLERRLAVRAHLRDALARPDVDSVRVFERALNGCLDLGYRAPPLAGFVFAVLERRLAGRARRRLARAGHDPSCAEVADLVSSTAEAIQRLLRGAVRERHTLTYALLLSITDHRTIDYLRRRRPEYRESVDDHASDQGFDAWCGRELDHDPEVSLVRREREQLARRVRDAVFAAVNHLPERERAALQMVEIDCAGYPEVSDRLGIRRSDVGNVVRRARLLRDRLLAPMLRGIAGLDGHLGFAAMQADKQLRLKMLSWSAEMGGGACPECRAHRWLLHPAEGRCAVT